ncbi:hypothetical protein DNTS_008654 [Danionella cerebrum]|uniref:Tissue factor n=1 Tax=Danionella cerebrum TaxID=2873325 RepID=A0A553MKE5_9TELE|nr:hypothetical protein DNTS_008654 [Danionella translucida]
MESKPLELSVIFLFWLSLVVGSPASVRNLPKAENVSWISHNFKTILTWGPRPVNYTYTVEFSRQATALTECDLTNEMDIKGVYLAEVLSEPLRGMRFDQVEFPYTRSKTFCPYNDTLIGRPHFKLTVNEKKKVVLNIQDPITALHKDGKSLTIRDVFKKNLKYKIAYNKAGSTGRKTLVVDESKAEFNRLDEDQSYCFSVAAFIPSRKGDKRLGDWSLPKCSAQGHKSPFDEYGLAVIGGAVLILLVLVVAIIILIVLWCKRVQRLKTITKETTV